MGSQIGRWVLFLVYFSLVIGCDSRRDLLNDPAVSPVVFPLAMQYDAQNAAVVLTWEYLGVEPAVRYRFVRSERDGIHRLPWRDLPPPSRSATKRADVWEMAPLVDDAVNSGEAYSVYVVRTETALEDPAEADFGSIRIPGGRLENIQFNPARGIATASWHVYEGTPLRYELFRQIDDAAPERVLQSDNPADTIFVDHVPGGNRTYRYTLRNFMDHNVVLDSRTFLLQPYNRREDFGLGIAADAHLVLTSAAALNSPILALIASSLEIAIRPFGHLGYLSGLRALPVSNRADLKLSSLSLAVMLVDTPREPRVLLSGVLSGQPRVQMSAFSLQNDVVSEVASTVWLVDDPDARTGMAVAPNGTILVFAADRGKAFALSGTTLVEVGALDAPGRIRSLAAFESGLWATTADGRLWRSAPFWIGELTAPQWEAIALPNGADAVWVDGAQQGVFVLDGAQQRVLTFDFEGQFGFGWQGLGDLDLNEAGVAVSLTGDVYVWDAQNQAALFKNASARLEYFPGQEE